MGAYDESKHNVIHQRGTHTAGNAVDIDIAQFYKKVKNKEHARSYINLVTSCAQMVGFRRFGVGRFGSLHMDTGIRANGQDAGKYWWVYDLLPKEGYTAERKNAHYAKGWMREEWTKNSYLPPDLTQWDYLKYRYGPDTRGGS